VYDLHHGPGFMSPSSCAPALLPPHLSLLCVGYYAVLLCVYMCMTSTMDQGSWAPAHVLLPSSMHIADWTFKYHAELLCYQSSASGNHNAGRLVQQVGQTHFQNDASALTLTSWIDSDFIHLSTCAIQLALFPGYLVQFITINVYTYLWHPMLPIVYCLRVQNLAIFAIHHNQISQLSLWIVANVDHLILFIMLCNFCLHFTKSIIHSSRLTMWLELSGGKLKWTLSGNGTGNPGSECVWSCCSIPT